MIFYEQRKKEKEFCKRLSGAKGKTRREDGRKKLL